MPDEANQTPPNTEPVAPTVENIAPEPSTSGTGSPVPPAPNTTFEPTQPTNEVPARTVISLDATAVQVAQPATTAPFPPVLGTPAVEAADITPQAPAPGTITMQPVIPGVTVHKSKKGLLFGLIGGGVVVVLAAVGFLVYYTLAHRVTAKDVADARQTANSINSDVDDLGTAVDALDNTTTTDAFDSKVSLVNSKLVDVQKDYKTLQASPIKRNKDINAKLATLDTKWAPFVGYVQDNVKDLQTLQPILLNYEDESTALSKQAPSTTAGLSTYLATFKSDIDTTSQKLSGIHMVVKENQQVLTSFQTFLQSSSQGVAKAQSDLNAGKDGLTVEDDLFSVSDAEDTFDSSLTSIQSQIDNHEKQVDPSTQFNDLQHSLDALYSQITK